MVSHRENRLDFADMMDRGKIFLARLPQGQMGKENSHLLGSLLVAKLQQMAMSRQRMEASERRPFFVYVDEFQNFICPSMAEILTGARKYGMGFILAHQDLRQLDRDKEVASAVLATSNRVVFRVSDSDARTLSEGFAHFPARELQNLPVGHAICRIGQSDHDFNLTVPCPEAPDQAEANTRRQAVIASSRERVAVPRARMESTSEGNPGVDPKKSESSHIPEPASVPGPESIPPAPVVAAGKEPKPDKVVKPGGKEAEPEVPSRPQSIENPSGRGETVHNAIQRRLLETAIAHGFKAHFEFEILEGQYRLDALVEGSDWKMACEVVDSSSVSKEIKTMKNCQQCGYRSGLIVCIDTDKLAVAQARCERELPDFNVQCILPVQLDSYFKALARQEEAANIGKPEMERVANHDLSRRSPKLSAKDRQRIEENALQAIAIAIRAQTESL